MIEWFVVEDRPSISNRYLVYSKNTGYSDFADYSSGKKAWTKGEGMEREEVSIDFWAYEPIPDGE